MPKPKGWTDAEVRLRDRCVDRLMEKGVPPGRTPAERERLPRSRAYAICTAMVEKRRRKKS